MPRAWIIGGTQGIGEVISRELKSHGMEVLATSEKDADVRSTQQLSQVFDKFAPEHIVYVAGINHLMPAAEFDEDEAINILDINVIGFMRVVRLAAQATHAVNGTRRIVAISSDAGSRPMRNSMAYCSSKAAMNMAVRCAARELAPHVQINAIAPGVVANTPHTDAVDHQVEAIKGWPRGGAEAADRASIPMGRRALKSEIAAMTYLALISPSYLTGEIINVNGGK